MYPLHHYDFNLTKIQALSLSVRSPIFIAFLKDECPMYKKQLKTILEMFDKLCVHSVLDLVSLDINQIESCKGIGHASLDILERTVSRLGLDLRLNYNKNMIYNSNSN